MTLRLATIQKCSRAFGQFCLSFSKRKKFGYNRTSFNTDSFRFRVRGVAGMDICVVLLLFIRMSCPRHEQKREVQCVFSRPCVLGGIFSLVFSFLPQLDLKWPSFRIDVKDVQECPTTCASSTKTAGISIT